MHWIWRKGSAEVIKIIFSLGYITVFIYFWLNINYRGTIESWATMYKEMKKIQTGNQVYCWSRKQTQKQRRISGFCRSIIFFGIKNVRVGGKILGSVSRSETHIFFFFGLMKTDWNIIYMQIIYNKQEGSHIACSEQWEITLSCKSNKQEYCTASIDRK